MLRALPLAVTVCVTSCGTMLPTEEVLRAPSLTVIVCANLCGSILPIWRTSVGVPKEFAEAVNVVLVAPPRMSLEDWVSRPGEECALFLGELLALLAAPNYFSDA